MAVTSGTWGHQFLCCLSLLILCQPPLHPIHKYLGLLFFFFSLLLLLLQLLLWIFWSPSWLQTDYLIEDDLEFPILPHPPEVCDYRYVPSCLVLCAGLNPEPYACYSRDLPTESQLLGPLYSKDTLKNPSLFLQAAPCLHHGSPEGHFSVRSLLRRSHDFSTVSTNILTHLSFYVCGWWKGSDNVAFLGLMLAGDMVVTGFFFF